jgi:hypothetical protein
MNSAQWERHLNKFVLLNAINNVVKLYTLSNKMAALQDSFLSQLTLLQKYRCSGAVPELICALLKH